MVKAKTYADLITKKNTTIPKTGISIETLKELKIGDIKKLDKQFRKMMDKK